MPPLPVSLGPTTISTPAKPMPAATQRSRRIGSLNTSTAPSMMKIGPVKPIAVVSARLMCAMAVNQMNRPRACTPPRVNWPSRLCGL